MSFQVFLVFGFTIGGKALLHSYRVTRYTFKLGDSQLVSYEPQNFYETAKLFLPNLCRIIFSFVPLMDFLSPLRKLAQKVKSPLISLSLFLVYNLAQMLSDLLLLARKKNICFQLWPDN